MLSGKHNGVVLGEGFSNSDPVLLLSVHIVCTNLQCTVQVLVNIYGNTFSLAWFIFSTIIF